MTRPLRTVSSRVEFGSDVTATVVLVGLVAKGAIAAFYLRELGTCSDDGAAYITSRRERANARPSEAMV